MSQIPKTIGLAGEALIKRSEGFRPYPYLCPANVPTIGYGTTVYPNGRKVTMKDAKITENTGDQLLHAVLRGYEDRLNALITVPCTGNQFDAMLSLAYNIGTTAFSKSSLLKLFNAKKPALAVLEFAKWNKGGGKVLPGLVARRAQEAELFMK